MPALPGAGVTWRSLAWGSHSWGRGPPGTPSQHLQGPLFLSYCPPPPHCSPPPSGPLYLIPTLGSISRPYSEALSPPLSSLLIVPTARIKGHHCQPKRLSAY